MNDAHGRFLHQLEQLDGHLSGRRLRRVERALTGLEQMARSPKDPAVKAEMSQVARAQTARVVELRRTLDVEAFLAARKRDAKPPNAVCERCGVRFRRGSSKKTKRLTCDVCRPPAKPSMSVRTVSGGLPTLGSNHR